MDKWSKMLSLLSIMLLFPSLLFAQDIGSKNEIENSCPQNVDIAVGATWRNITIGQSSLFDIEEIFGIRFAYVVSLASEQIYENRLYVHLTDERAYKEGLPTYTEVCVIKGKLASIILTPDADRETPSSFLHEWIQLYGIPDIVTWDSSGNSWRWRSIAWSDKGIILTVDASPTTNNPTIALVDSVMFAPFSNSDDPLSSWPYSTLSTEPPTSTNEGYPAEQNPFDFDGMLELESSK